MSVSATVMTFEREDAAAGWLRACELAYPKVHRGLVAMGAAPEDAADAAQDAFERALSVRPVPRSAEGWLFVVALRRWKRARWRQRLFRPLAHTRSTVEHARDGEIDLLVELARLTERQRTVLVAHHALGLSYPEIGAVLGIAPATVGAIAYQATRILRERLGGDHDRPNT